jgi:hypothetical protein
LEVGDELFSGEGPHGALKNSMLQVFGFHVASGAAGGEPVVVPGLVGGKVAFLSTELVEATTCKFVQFHKVVWFKF